MSNPVSVLLEDQDPVRRSRAHLTLGRQAMERRELEIAREHLAEAWDLDPTDETPRKLLDQLQRPRRRWFGLL